ncbi:MAG: ATP-binding protein [Acidobacteria bacterium]|nr:ATP-binding protein [Acidobacteriota bacterium]
MNRHAQDSLKTDFQGLVEYPLLKEYPPTPKTLNDARGHIERLVVPDGVHNVSLPEEEKSKRAANELALFLFSVERSLECLPGYATLDHKHTNKIIEFTRRIEEYAEDQKNSQPLNFVITASPGEGKSHFVECVAKTKNLKKRVEVVLFNMASMRGPDDLAAAVDGARNVTVRGKLPLLFLDEFDSKMGEYYPLLLPLLWDGRIALGDHRLEIGRAVIVLAGSSDEVTAAFQPAAGSNKPADSDKPDTNKPRKNANKPRKDRSGNKLTDLVSRINGTHINIPSLNDNESDRQVDKVCVAIALLRRKYGAKLRAVPTRLLRFIYDNDFEHGVRSIRHLIERIGNTKREPDSKPEREEDKDQGKKPEGVVDDDGKLDIGRLEAIFETEAGVIAEGLRYHLSFTEPKEIIDKWKGTGALAGMVPVWCEAFENKYVGPPTTWTKKNAGLNSWLMFRELKGGFDKKDPLDVTAYAGIEPLALTQFWLNPPLGEWMHGNDKMRHIMFNLRTLQQLMLKVVNKSQVSDVVVKSKSLPEVEPGSPQDIGRQMGRGFGQDFVTFLPSIEQMIEININSTVDWINQWCTFDVSGGWGSWGHVPGDNAQTGQLVVSNNFLASEIPEVTPEPGEKSPFCPIMVGYVEGVLDEILREVHAGKEYSLKVEDKGCGYPAPKDKPCIFEYTVTFAN